MPETRIFPLSRLAEVLDRDETPRPGKQQTIDEHGAAPEVIDLLAALQQSVGRARTAKAPLPSEVFGPPKQRTAPAPMAELPAEQPHLDLRVGPNPATKGRPTVFWVHSPSHWVPAFSKTDLWHHIGRGEPLGEALQPVVDQIWAAIETVLPAAAVCPEVGCRVLVDAPGEPCGDHYLELLRDQAADLGRVAGGSL